VLQLGRKPSRCDPRTLRFAKYVDARQLPAAPPARDWTHLERAPRWGLFRNDTIGDCTCAAIGHALQAQAANNHRPITISDTDVVRLYSRVTGYDPRWPETDQGAEMLDVLTEMRNGVGLAGQRIGAFASVDPLDRNHVEAAVNLLGWCYVGADLPLAAQDQTVWDVAPTHGYTAAYVPNSWGGHAMAMLGYDRTHVVLLTWGQVKIATREWFSTYVSEAWAAIGQLWLDDTSMLSPSGFALPDLMADLVEIDRVDRGASQA